MTFKGHGVRSWGAQAQAVSSFNTVPPQRRTRLARGIQASIVTLGIVSMSHDALAGPPGGYSVGTFDNAAANGASSGLGSCLYSGTPGAVSTATSATDPCNSSGGGRQAGIVAWTPTGGYGAYMLFRNTDQIAFGAGSAEKFRILNTGLVALDDMAMSSNKITGLAAGIVSTGSDEAVNGSQLHGVASRTATALGGGAAVNSATGAWTAPSYTVGGTTVNNVGAALNNVDARVSSNTSAISSNTTSINNLTNGTAGLVRQNATTRNITVGAATDGTQVSIAGTGGNRLLTGVAAGTVSAASVDAINGSQLHGSATSVANALGGGSAVQPNGTVSAPSYTVGGSAVNNVGAAVSNIDGRTTQNSTDIAGNTSAINNLANGTTGLVQQNATTRNITVGGATDGAQVSIAGTAGNRLLTGVVAGTVSAASVDAINGTQLHGNATSVANALGGSSAVQPDGTVSAPAYTVGGTTVSNVGAAVSNIDGRTTQNSTDISNLSTAVGNGTTGLVRQDAATRNITVGAATDGTQVSIAGTAGSRLLTGVAPGTVSATSVDAINGSQLHGGATSVANALGGGSAVQPDGTVSAPTYTVGGSAVNNVGAAVSNIDGRTTQNSSDISTLSNAIGSGTTGLVRQDATTRNISVGTATDGTQVSLAGTAGNRLLTGVAAGTVSATSVDAINGSQLQGTASSLSSALGGGSAVNPDGTVSAPSYTVGGTTVNSVGAAITNVDGRTTQNTTDIAGNTTAISNLSNAINNGTTGLVQQDAATRNLNVGAAADGTQVSFAGTGGNRVLTGVAPGAVSATSVDAVNGSQLHGTASSAASALGGGSVVNPDGTLSAPGYSVGGTTVGSVGAAVTNLDGRTTTNTSNIAQNTTDIAGNTTAISNLSTAIGNGTTGLVQQASPTSDVTVAGATGGSRVNFAGTGGPRVLTGVAAGTVNATSVDAVNGSQLHGTATSVASALGGGAAVNPDGTLSAPSYTVGGTTVNTVAGAVGNLDGRVTQNSTDIAANTTAISGLANGTVGLVQQDAATRNITVGAATDGTGVNFAGTAGNRVLTGVAAGSVSATSVDVINGSQLHASVNSMAVVLGGGPPWGRTAR